MKIAFVIYSDTKSLLEKYNENPENNNPEKYSTIKISKHRAHEYLLFMYCLFDTTKTKYDYYRVQ